CFLLGPSLQSPQVRTMSFLHPRRRQQTSHPGSCSRAFPTRCCHRPAVHTCWFLRDKDGSRRAGCVRLKVSTILRVCWLPGFRSDHKDARFSLRRLTQFSIVSSSWSASCPSIVHP